MVRCTILIVFLLLFSSQQFSQTSSPLNRRYSTIDNGKVKTVFTNYGVVAQPANLTPRGAWKYDHNGYIGDFSFVVGVELPIKDYTGDGIKDTIHGVSITAVDRPGGGKTFNGRFAGFEPVNNFFRPGTDTLHRNEIACSFNPATWPETWPDHPEWGTNVWYGLNGPNTFTGGDEFLYQVDDAADAVVYNHYGFLPDSTKPSIYGRGINVTVRHLTFHTPEISDVLFTVYDVKNTSIHNYSKVVFGELCGTYVGLFGDEWNDDASLYYAREKMALTFDFESYIRPSSNPRWMGPVGVFGHKMIDGPGIKGISGWYGFQGAGNIHMSDDEFMWKWLMPNKLTYPPNIVYNDSIPTALGGSDADYLCSSNYFALNAGETKRIASMIVFGDDLQNVRLKSKIAEAYYNNNFQMSQISQKIQLTSMFNGDTLSGIKEIKWNSNTPDGTIEIYYIKNSGEEFTSLTTSAPNTGSWMWNTSLVGDSPFGKLIILLKDANGICVGFCYSGSFIVKNSPNPTCALIPQIKYVNETITEPYVSIPVLAASTGSAYILNITVFHGTQVIGTASATNSLYTQHVSIPLNPILNGENVLIGLRLWDGYSADTAYFTVTKMEIPGAALPPYYIHVLSGAPEVFYQVIKADLTALKDHEYELTFKEPPTGRKTMKIFDRTSGQVLLNDYAFTSGQASPMIDGFYFYQKDFVTSVDRSKSGWNIPRTNNIEYSAMSEFSPELKGKNVPFDYAVVFSNEYNSSSSNLSQLLPGLLTQSSHLNFKVFDITKPNHPKQVKFGYIDNERPDTISDCDMLLISDENESMLTYMVFFTGTGSSYVPTGGDTLFLRTKKGFSIYDTLLITGLTITAQESEIGNAVNFSLGQNYPNPFNPVSVIEYTLPSDNGVQMVTLKLFDMLGREVSTLVNQQQLPGKYSIRLDASHFSSGVYFYTLKAGKYSATKKCIVLK